MQEKELRCLFDSLTIEEKIYQLVQLSGDFYQADAMAVGPQAKLGISQEVVDNAGSILNVLGAEKVKRIQTDYLAKSRHKIPLLFMADIIYGYKTIYPIPLGLGCTWEPELVKTCNEGIAKEASAAGAQVTFAPMVDLVRDARWGRCMESTGEDTYLNSIFAKAMVEGFQGDFTSGESLASCVKHFAGYGAAEAGREYNTVDMSERRLRQDYLPSYQAAVNAGCELVMTSFNTVDEIPATANKWLMDDILRKEWGFDGVIITDYAAIEELIAHGIAENEREAAKLAMEATVDIDMKTSCYANQLKPLMENGEISSKLIDDAVWRVLKLKNKLGLFENPFRGASEESEKELQCSVKSRELAREVVTKATVLLKNKNDILPIRSKSKKIALIGPYADSKDLIGLWAIHGDREDVVTLKTGMEEQFDPEHLQYARGCDVLDDYSCLGEFGNIPASGKSTQMTKEEARVELKKAVEIAQESDVVILALGEHMMQSGEAGSRTDITLPSIQLELLEKIHVTKTPIVLVLFNGRPLVLTEVENKVDAILEGWFPGTEGGHGITDIIVGKVNPSGRITMSFPYAVGQIPVYYNEFNTGRPIKTSTHSGRFMSKFLDCPNEPLYPFGYGLSYGTCQYSDITIDKQEFSKGETLVISTTVTNTSDMKREETVQLYIRDLIGSVVRPVKELKGWEKVVLKAGEAKTVQFSIKEEMLQFYTKSMEYKAEPGEFIAYIGRNSRDIEAEFRFTYS